MHHQPTLNWSKHGTHGRKREKEEIHKIVQEIHSQHSPSKIVAITGPSGIGKSALVTEGVLTVAGQLGYTASGKFDQFLPQTPYAAVLKSNFLLKKCLRTLFSTFFFSNPHVTSQAQAQHVQSLIDFVGPNKEILCGAIPELAPLLPGPINKSSSLSTSSGNINNKKSPSPFTTSPIPSPFSFSPFQLGSRPNSGQHSSNGTNGPVPLSPGPSMHSHSHSHDSVSISESRNRFHTIFLGILGMITAESMVTIFVDDVQWADTASLELLASLIEGQTQNLLIIVTSRESSLPGPLATLPGTTVIDLHPFTHYQVLEFVCSMLNLPESETSLTLATAIHSRTAGNPFFVSQLLRQAISDGIISYDSRTFEWVINFELISQMSIVSDVVEFLLEKLQKLPASVSQVLRVAACLGSTFSVDTLQMVLAKHNGADMRGLDLAEAEGLVVRVNSETGPTGFRFSHDRVMQASHSKNTDLQIQQIHLAAGEVLMQQRRDLYEVADHFAKSLPLIPPEQMQNLCALFLKVAKNAKLAAAFDSASRYAQVGIDILKKIHADWSSAWRQNYNLTYLLLMITMDCAFNHKDIELSQACYKDIQEHATLEDAVHALSARINLLINESQFSDAIDMGCEGIARLGITGLTLPRHPTQAELGALFTEINGMLQGNIYTTFESLPPLTHQLVSLAITILASTGTASYFCDIAVFAFSSSLVVKLTLQYGLTPQATPGLAIYALLCSSITGDFKRAYEMGEEATLLSNRYGLPAYQCQVHFIFYSILQFYQKHIRENVAHLRRGQILCAQVGNTLYGAFTAQHIPITRLWQGDTLEGVTEEYILTFKSLGAQCRFADAFPMTSAGLYCCRSLMGINSPKDLEDSKVHISPFGTAWAATLRVKAHNLLHRHEDVLADVNAHCQNVFEDIKGQMPICMLYFHYSLTLASLFYREPSNSPKSVQYVEKLQENLVTLLKWATCSQINCEHRYVLVQAELAHILNKNAEALELYERASRIAIQHEFHHHNAIVLERMSTFFLRTGHRDRARETLIRSLNAYSRWGACAVVGVLVEEHADLLGVNTIVPLDSLAVVPSGKDGIDVSAVLACSSIVSESTNLGKLITSFLSRIVTYLNVEYGCLLLTQANSDACYTHVRWSRHSNGTECAALLRPPVLVPEICKDATSMICVRAVRCAVLMKRTVVVNNLATSGMSSDAYFGITSNVASLLCMPFLLHGKVLGAVYLESNVPNTFTLGNLETLQLMCAQASITIENSQLVEKEIIARAEAEAAISEKDSALKEMQASQQRYQTLAQAIPQLIWISKADGFVEWANDQFISFLGSSELGDVWSEHIHPADLARTRSAWVAATVPGSTFCEEFRMKDAQGNYQWFLSRAMSAHDTKGNVIRWFGTNTNIDAQKKNLEERARLSKVEVSERYYRALAEALPQLVWTSLPDGRVNYYNGKWKEFSGVTLIEGEIMGWWPLVHTDDVVACRKQFERSNRKCKGFVVECRIKRHDGQFRWHLVRAVRLKDPIEGTSAPLVPSPSMQSMTDDTEETNCDMPESGYYYFGTCTDIDDQKKAEVSLIEARKSAEHMAEMKSQWVANMSHELRTPSNGILGMLDLLMDTPLTPEQKDYVATMRRSTNVLLTVISDILDFRKNETKQVKLQPEPFLLRGVMEDVCEILFPLASAKKLELVHLVTPDVPRVLVGDPARLRQVLVNLIGNSIKFSQEGNGHVEVLCKITTPEQLVKVNNVPPLPLSSSTNSTLSSPITSPGSSCCISPLHSPTYSPPPSPHLRRSGEVKTASNFRPIDVPSPSSQSASPNSECSLRTSTSSLNCSPTLPTCPNSAAFSPSQQTVWLRFDVKDCGVGIPKAQQAKLFEPFFQVDSSATRKYGGTGLGLAISRQIVHALGGTIWVQSEEGCGSTFSFTAQFSIPPLPLPISHLSSSDHPHNSRFFTPHLSSVTGEPPSIHVPQHILVFSDLKGATMRVLLEYLSQLTSHSSSDSQISVAQSDSELIDLLSKYLSQLPPSAVLPYIVCIIELSNVPAANSMLARLTPYLSSNEYIFKVIMITSPHLRAQICLPVTSPSFPHSPYSAPSTPLCIPFPSSPPPFPSAPQSIIFLMKPLSESKLRTALSHSASNVEISTTNNKSNPQSPATNSHLNSNSDLSKSTSTDISMSSSTIQQHPSPLHEQSLPVSSFNSSASSPVLLASSFSSPSTNSTKFVPPPLLSLSDNEDDDHGGPKVSRALCAEDNPVNQKVIVWNLRKLGFAIVDIANDGAEAVEKVTSRPGGYYEFLLMDLQMPVMDGFVATKLIREKEAANNRAPLPIIAITANVMPDVQQQCNDAGMDGYISKPVQMSQLVQVFNDLAILK